MEERMKRITTAIVIGVLLALGLISGAREAAAAKVYVENADATVNGNYDITTGGNTP
jgi:hypothetical protein